MIVLHDCITRIKFLSQKEKDVGNTIYQVQRLADDE